jgi:hypothetical protein
MEIGYSFIEIGPLGFIQRWIRNWENFAFKLGQIIDPIVIFLLNIKHLLLTHIFPGKIPGTKPKS